MTNSDFLNTFYLREVGAIQRSKGLKSHMGEANIMAKAAIQIMVQTAVNLRD
jgi:hypothetical protein